MHCEFICPHRQIVTRIYDLHLCSAVQVKLNFKNVIEPVPILQCQGFALKPVCLPLGFLHLLPITHRRTFHGCELTLPTTKQGPQQLCIAPHCQCLWRIGAVGNSTAKIKIRRKTLTGHFGQFSVTVPSWVAAPALTVSPTDAKMSLFNVLPRWHLTPQHDATSPLQGIPNPFHHQCRLSYQAAVALKFVNGALSAATDFTKGLLQDI